MRSKYKYRQKPLHQLTPDELRAQAETRFRKAEQVLRERTAQLRAERLAREGSGKP